MGSSSRDHMTKVHLTEDHALNSMRAGPSLPDGRYFPSKHSLQTFIEPQGARILRINQPPPSLQADLRKYYFQLHLSRLSLIPLELSYLT